LSGGVDEEQGSKPVDSRSGGLARKYKEGVQGGEKQHDLLNADDNSRFMGWWRYSIARALHLFKN